MTLPARHFLAKALLTAVLLRAIMPMGYMPGSLSDGLPFELCPEGLPASVLAVLKGQERHHHHLQPDDGAEPQVSVYEQCDFGHLCTPAVTDFDSSVNSLPPVATAVADNLATVLRLNPRLSYSPRAPPVAS